MGYYRRYTLFYFLVAFAEAALWLLLVGTIYQIAVLFLVAAFVVTAVFYTVLAARRYQRAVSRMVESADTTAFLAENARCIKASSRKTRTAMQLNQVYALMLEGRFDEATQLMEQIRPKPRRQKRLRLNNQLGYAMRSASLALFTGRMQDARAQIEQMQQALRELAPTDSLFTHYDKAMQDLTQQLAVREGGGQAYVAYFENQAKSSGARVTSGSNYFYLGLAQENAGDTAQALVSYDAAVQQIPGLFLGRQAAERAAQLRAQS